MAHIEIMTTVEGEWWADVPGQSSVGPAKSRDELMGMLDQVEFHDSAEHQQEVGDFLRELREGK